MLGTCPKLLFFIRFYHSIITFALASLQPSLHKKSAAKITITLQVYFISHFNFHFFIYIFKILTFAETKVVHMHTYGNTKLRKLLKQYTNGPMHPIVIQVVRVNTTSANAKQIAQEKTSKETVLSPSTSVKNKCGKRTVNTTSARITILPQSPKPTGRKNAGLELNKVEQTVQKEL